VDWNVVLARPVEEVFAILADPARLSEWLPGLTCESSGVQAELGATATVIVDGPNGPEAAIAEMTAFEPPWLVSYRLLIGARTLTLRVTCTAQADQTRLHIRQSGDAAPLTPRFSTPSPGAESTAQGDTQ
jgi:uncharacterized protein YndB with AHSA1/START domain